MQCKFFDPTSHWTWYGIEGEPAPDIYGDYTDFEFYGYVIGHVAELGYFRLSELENAKKGSKGIKALPIERDLYFTPCPLSKVRQEAKEI